MRVYQDKLDSALVLNYPLSVKLPTECKNTNCIQNYTHYQVWDGMGWMRSLCGAILWASLCDANKLSLLRIDIWYKILVLLHFCTKLPPILPLLINSPDIILCLKQNALVALSCWILHNIATRWRCSHMFILCPFSFPYMLKIIHSFCFFVK